MVDKPPSTVILDAIRLGRKLLAASGILVAAGFGGQKIIQKVNDGPPGASAVSTNASQLEAVLEEGGAVASASSSTLNSVPAGLKGNLARQKMGSHSSSFSSNSPDWNPPTAPPRIFDAAPVPPNGDPGGAAAAAPTSPPAEAGGGGTAFGENNNGAGGGGAFNGGGNSQMAQNTLASNGAVGADGQPMPASLDPNAAPAGAIPTTSDGSGGGPAASTAAATATTNAATNATTTPNYPTNTAVISTALSVVATASLPSVIMTSSTFTPSPAYNVQYKTSQAIATTVTGATKLSAFLDSSCLTAADGTFSVAVNPVALTLGASTFGTVSYALPGHLEENLYLQALITPRSLSSCSTSAIRITQRFNAGSGFATQTSTSNGFAGASAAARKSAPYALDVDSTGRYYAGGMSTNVSGGNELFIARYFPDGTLDTSFASGGVYLFQNNSTGPGGVAAASRNDQIYGLKIDNGLVVATGITTDASGGTDVFVLRLLSTGTLDTSFGGTGMNVLQLGAAGFSGAVGAAKDDEVSPYNALAIDSMDRYIIPISSKNTAGGREAGVIAMTAAGVVDTTFGTNGITLIAHGAASPTGATNATRSEYPAAIQIDGTGNLVIAYAAGTMGARDALVARFTYTGVLDVGFNTTGFNTVHSALGSSSPAQLRIDSTGLIIGVEKIGTRLALFRLTAAGIADVSFATNGLSVFNSSGPSAGGNAAAADLPADFIIDPTTGDYDVYGSSANASNVYVTALWKFLPTGSLDTSFGTGATGYLTFQNGTSDLAGYSGAGAGDLLTGHMVFDNLSRALLPVQTINANQNSDFALIRFLRTGAVDK